MQNNQIKPIHKFILKDKHNLRIAAAVTEAWSEVRAQIVTGFLDKLGTRLRKKLKGWKFESQEHFFIDQYPKYFWFLDVCNG